MGIHPTGTKKTGTEVTGVRPYKKASEEFGKEFAKQAGTAALEELAEKLGKNIADFSGPLKILFEYANFIMGIFERLGDNNKLTYLDGFARALTYKNFGRNPYDVKFLNPKGDRLEEIPFITIQEKLQTQGRSIITDLGMSFYKGKMEAIIQMERATQIKVTPYDYFITVFKQLAIESQVPRGEIEKYALKFKSKFEPIKQMQ